MIKDALRQFFTYGAGTIAQTALGFILLPLYLRFFEPSEYGVISLLLVAVSLLTLFANVGIVSGLFMLYYEAEAGERKKLVGNTWLWYLLGATLGGVILFTQAPSLSQLLFHTVDYSYPIRLVGVFFFFSLLQNIPLTILRLEKKAGHYVGFSVAKFGIDFGLKLCFIAFLGRGIGGYFESGVIANIIILCSVLPFTLKYVSFSVNISYLKRLLRLGSPFVFSTIAVWTLGMSDRLILNYFCGAAEVGVYSLAYIFANLFNIFLYTPFGLFWTPFFLSFVSERPKEDTKILIERAMRYTLILGGMLYLAISLGCGDVLLIFRDLFAAKEGYLEAARLVPLLALGPFFYFLHGRFASPLFVVKRPEFVARAGLIAAATNLGLNFLLIPRFGAFGAALTTAIAYALFMVLTYIWSQRLYPVNYHLWGLAKGFLFLVVAFTIGWQIGIAQPWASLFTRVIVGVAVFGLLTWFMSGILTKDERRRLLGYLVDGRKKLAAMLLRKS